MRIALNSLALHPRQDRASHIRHEPLLTENFLAAHEVLNIGCPLVDLSLELLQLCDELDGLLCRLRVEVLSLEVTPLLVNLVLELDHATGKKKNGVDGVEIGEVLIRDLSKQLVRREKTEDELVQRMDERGRG